jgi:hypothetical protein
MTLTTTFLGKLTAGIDRFVELGQTPFGVRRFAILGEGTLKGPRIDAKILPGGSDSLLRDAGGAGHPDVRFVLETTDGATILVSYQGIRVVEEGKPDYWRCTPTFQTASPEYDWLNRIICVAIGRLGDGGVVYDFHQVD